MALEETKSMIANERNLICQVIINELGEKIHTVSDEKVLEMIHNWHKNNIMDYSREKKLEILELLNEIYEKEIYVLEKLNYFSKINENIQNTIIEKSKIDKDIFLDLLDTEIQLREEFEFIFLGIYGYEYIQSNKDMIDKTINFYFSKVCSSNSIFRIAVERYGVNFNDLVNTVIKEYEDAGYAEECKDRVTEPIPTNDNGEIYLGDGIYSKSDDSWIK